MKDKLIELITKPYGGVENVTQIHIALVQMQQDEQYKEITEVMNGIMNSSETYPSEHLVAFLRCCYPSKTSLVLYQKFYTWLYEQLSLKALDANKILKGLGGSVTDFTYIKLTQEQAKDVEDVTKLAEAFNDKIEQLMVKDSSRILDLGYAQKQVTTAKLLIVDIITG